MGGHLPFGSVMSSTTSPTPAPYKLERSTHPEAEMEWPWPKIEPKVYDILLGAVVESDGTPESSVIAAQGVNSLYLEFIEGPATAADFLWNLWELVTRGFAAKLPWEGVNQDRLIGFLNVLRTLPDPVDIDLGDWGTYKVWGDLPLLGPVSNENWNSYDFDSEEGRNMGGFVARLTQEGIIDFSWMGLWAFNKALETKPSRRSKRLKKQGAEADAYVPLTLVWLRLAGKKLYNEALAGSLKDEEEGNEMGGNWKGRLGIPKSDGNFGRRGFSNWLSIHSRARGCCVGKPWRSWRSLRSRLVAGPHIQRRSHD